MKEQVSLVKEQVQSFCGIEKVLKEMKELEKQKVEIMRDMLKEMRYFNKRGCVEDNLGVD